MRDGIRYVFRPKSITDSRPSRSLLAGAMESLRGSY
jgi:hypothetical protein